MQQWISINISPFFCREHYIAGQKKAAARRGRQHSFSLVDWVFNFTDGNTQRTIFQPFWQRCEQKMFVQPHSVGDRFSGPFGTWDIIISSNGLIFNVNKIEHSLAYHPHSTPGPWLQYLSEYWMKDSCELGETSYKWGHLAFFRCECNFKCGIWLTSIGVRFVAFVIHSLRIFEMKCQSAANSNYFIFCVFSIFCDTIHRRRVHSSSLNPIPRFRKEIIS